MKKCRDKRSFLLILLLVMAFLSATLYAADEDPTSLEKINNLTDKDRATLELILSGDNSSLIKALDEGMLDVNSSVGGNPLSALAIYNGKLGVFETLLEHGADPNATGVRGKSLLIVAAENVRPEFVAVLLKMRGIKTSAVDANNMSATDYVKNYTLDKAASLKKASNRPESVYVLRRQAEDIYNRILEYRANSFIRIDESVFMNYLPESVRSLMRSSVLGRPIWRWAVAILFLLLTMLINRISQKYFTRIIDRYKNDRESAEDNIRLRGTYIVSAFMALRSSLRFIIRWIGIYVVLAILIPVVLEAASWTLDVIITYAVAVFFYNLSDIIETIVMRWMDKTELRLSSAISTLLKKSIRFVIVMIAALHIYSIVTGNSITTLIAGLGIGGMAVALAATDTLKNLLGFVTIVTDKPFVVGERVEVKGYDGVVEHIGLRATMIRRLDGHLVSIPNSLTVSDAVRNIARRPYLKKEISITVTYDTPLVKVEKAVEIVKDILDNHQGMNPEYPPRVFFTNMNADNLEILATFWFFPADWYPFCELNQWVNFEIMRRFEAEGIEFAFPTQTLYLAGDPNRKLTIGRDDAASKL